MSDVYMQTSSGKVKLAAAAEVDNMASSISRSLGGTLVGTTCAYITKDLNVSLPVAGDYVIVKSLTFGDFPSNSGSVDYSGVKTNDGVTLLYKGGTGYIAAASAKSYAYGNSENNNIVASKAAAATATLNASGTSINFKSNLSEWNGNMYNTSTCVNIEIYKLK